MKYVLLIYGDERMQETASSDQRQAMYEAYDKYGNWLVERGCGDPLHRKAERRPTGSDDAR